ncbi:MAG: hypothetical protein WC043_02655 [Pseudobdellovibrionaceae bacterium]
MTHDKRKELIETYPNLLLDAATEQQPVASVQARVAFKKGAAQPPAKNVTQKTPVTAQALPMWIENKAEIEDEKQDPMFRAWVHHIFNFDEPFLRTGEEESAITQALKYYANSFRQLDDEDRQARCLTSHDTDNEDSPSPSGSTGYGTYDILRHGGSRHSGRTHGSALIEIPPLTKMQVGERQAAINSLLPKAAAEIGVSPEIMKGIWYKETKFSTLKEVSSTGCIGPWQFTRGTFAENILGHGDQIARSLKAAGYEDEAIAVAKYHYALRNKTVDTRDQGLQSLRMNTAISTYAATHYVADIAKRQGLDATDIKNGGKLYAAYNVGEGSLDKLEKMAANGNTISAKGALGWVADVNPQFYKNGANASEVLQNYQTAIEHGVRQHAYVFSASPTLAQNGKDITQTASAAPAITERKPASRIGQVLQTLGISSPEPS